MTALYDEIGKGYVNLRVPDSRIARLIHRALGDARTVANVGAGTGSYEPLGGDVFAIEPSTLMLKQYRGTGKRVQGTAEAMPLRTDAVDATMGVLTLHHWQDWHKGLTEMFRVSRQVAVLLTHKPDLYNFWLYDYFPEIRRIDQSVFASIGEIEAHARLSDWQVERTNVAIPADCTDGFLGAYWQRPSAYLNANVRRSISSFSLLDADRVADTLELLRDDLDSGAWADRYGHLYDIEELDIGYRILRMTPIQ